MKNLKENTYNLKMTFLKAFDLLLTGFVYGLLLFISGAVLFFYVGLAIGFINV